MELTSAIINNIVSVTHSWDDNNATEYLINKGLALSHAQIIQLTELFRLDYAVIKKATNWGTRLKFDVLIEHSKFRVPAEMEDAFKIFVDKIEYTHAPTETNFWYYLEPDFKY